MKNKMVFIGLGSNLGGQKFGSPRSVLESAINELSNFGMAIKRLSPFYESEPVPKSDQPWFVNAVVLVDTKLSARDLLHNLHEIEARLGRLRRIRWEARIIDLDIIAYEDHILPSLSQWPVKGADINSHEIIIPHPRLHERMFVLRPLMDISPGWVHPVLGKTVEELLKAVELDSEQSLRVISRE